jgi:hypothetical protein
MPRRYRRAPVAAWTRVPNRLFIYASAFHRGPALNKNVVNERSGARLIAGLKAARLACYRRAIEHPIVRCRAKIGDSGRALGQIRQVVDFSADRFGSKHAVNVIAGNILRARVVRLGQGPEPFGCARTRSFRREASDFWPHAEHAEGLGRRRLAANHENRAAGS